MLPRRLRPLAPALLASLLCLSTLAATVPTSAPLATAERQTGAQVADLAGTWQLDRRASDSIPPAVERATSSMNPIVRMVAKRRLTRLNPAYATLRLELLAADSIAVAWGGELPVRALPNGIAISHRTRDGERMSATILSSPSLNGSLEERYDTSDGRRVNRWQRVGTDRLEVSVIVSGPRLPTPLQYRLVYRRPSAPTSAPGAAAAA